MCQGSKKRGGGASIRGDAAIRGNTVSGFPPVTEWLPLGHIIFFSDLKNFSLCNVIQQIKEVSPLALSKWRAGVRSPEGSRFWAPLIKSQHHRTKL